MGRDQKRPWVNEQNSHSAQGPSVKAAPYPVVCNPTASSPMEVQNDAQHNAGARGLLQIKGNPIGSINGEPENCGMQWLTLVLGRLYNQPRYSLEQAEPQQPEEGRYPLHHYLLADQHYQTR